MAINIYQVDAFTDKVFGGNPAAVCPLDTWLPDETLQNIAAENNLSETAFFVSTPDKTEDYELRWFTPVKEVDLCGHATLAAAHVILNEISSDKEKVSFSSRSGPLYVARSAQNGLKMDFPAWRTSAAPAHEDLNKALGAAPTSLHRGQYWMAVFENEEQVKSIKPDFSALKKIEEIGFLIITAPSDNPDIDFVSRFFCPQYGIDEDPVTGSAHCILTPYWADRLKKKALHAHQSSLRGGELLCTLNNDRIEISGHSVLYMQGKINV